MNGFLLATVSAVVLVACTPSPTVTSTATSGAGGDDATTSSGGGSNGSTASTGETSTGTASGGGMGGMASTGVTSSVSTGGSGTGGMASASATSSASSGGDPCTGIECSTPPAATCASGTTLRTYDALGACSAGTCSYSYVDTVCPSGCNGAACITLPITLSAGFAHTCAVVSGGVKCWGGNSDGQLGNNSTTTSLVPTPVPGLPSNVLSLAAGNNHTCAVTSPATIKCWGRNEYGQLGNNSLTQSLFPVSVVGF